jgi:hypothetical protein
VTNYNINREQFSWAKIWGVVGAFLHEVSMLRGPDLACMAVEVLRQTAARFLKNPELRELHFQEHFMRLFPDIFEGHANSRVKCYVLECIQRLLADLAPNFRSGWGVVFNLLTIAAFGSDTEDLAFSILKQIIDRNLGILHSLFPALLQTIAPFVDAPKGPIKVAAAGLYEKIAKEADFTDASAWDSIIKGMARAASSPNEDVRRVIHAATVTISGFVLTKNPPDSIVTQLLTDGLPFYFTGANDDRFFGQAATFLTHVVDDIIVPFWEVFARYFSDVLKLMFIATTHSDERLSATGIGVFGRFAKAFWDRFGDAEVALIVDTLQKVAANIGKFTLVNAKSFVTGIIDIVEISKRRQFVDVIARIDEVCRAEERLLELDAFVRQLLLAGLLIVGDTDEEVMECVRGTLEIYTERKFGKNPDEEPGKAWNLSVGLAAARIAELQDDLFVKCFDAAAKLIVELVLAESLEVRRQVKIVMRRRLIG